MLITFEGPEGSGKTTQIKLAAEWLQDLDYRVIETREPGGTLIGDQIRQTLHDVGNATMVSEAEILLYSASRAQLVGEVIRPNLAQPNTVILCDRYFDSTYAYQGYGRGLDLEKLRTITNFATGGLKPDLTIFLDIDVERGLERRVDNAEEMNRLDLEKVEFHQRVRAGYFALLGQDERWVIVDADRPLEVVQAHIQKLLMAKIPEDL